jgi:hypothetical protein
MDFPGFDLNNPADCKEASALNDRFIRRCADLWGRFAFLPARDELIEKTVKGEFPASYLQNLTSFSYLPPPGDPMIEDADAAAQPPADADDAKEEEEEAAKEAEADGHLPEEITLMRTLSQNGRMMSSRIYQLMFDWCNLYAIVLPDGKRREGIQTLGLLALLLANISSSLDQLSCFQIEMAINLCQRARKTNQDLCQMLAALTNVSQPLREVIAPRLRSLQQLDNTLQKHIDNCRRLGEQQRPF